MPKKVIINEQEFIEQWESGKTDTELAIVFNCSNSYIGKYRKQLNLKANVRRVGKKTLIDREKFISLVNEGKSNQELSKIFNVTPPSIKKAKKRFGIQNEDERSNKPIILTHEQKEVLFGSALGDAYIQIQQKNAEVVIQHSKKQEEYISYLQSYFPNIPHFISSYERCDIRTGKTYQVQTLRLNANKAFNEFREMFYNNDKKKIIPIKYLEEYYTPLAMAIHYCDDGWNEGHAAIFATCSFTLEELYELKKFLFNKYSLKTTITKSDHRIRIRACSYDHFIELIREYIPDCMKYKITKKLSRNWVKKGNS